MIIQSDPNKPNPEYVRKEVDFLKSMEEGMKLEEIKNIDQYYLILILSQDIELGFQVTRLLKDHLGEQARILRFHRPMRLSKIKDVFAPEVLISSSNRMLHPEHESDAKTEMHNSGNGFLLFLANENANFSEWLCMDNRMRHIHNAWHQLNGY